MEKRQADAPPERHTVRLPLDPVALFDVFFVFGHFQSGFGAEDDAIKQRAAGSAVAGFVGAHREGDGVRPARNW